MRWLAGLLVSAVVCGGGAAAEDVPVPLPRPRPVIWLEPHSFAEAVGPGFDSTQVTAEPSECRKRLKQIATIVPMPRLIGPGECGVGDAIEIAAVKLPDGGEVTLNPAPLLRCEMAEQLASWVREAAAPAIVKAGAALKRIETYDDFECRGRNRVFGAKLSEHGKGNAVDLRAFALADNRLLMLTDEQSPSRCAKRFASAPVRVSPRCWGPVPTATTRTTFISTWPSATMATASASGMCASRSLPRWCRCRFHGRKSSSLRMVENSSPPFHHSGVALA